ncbi:MAG: lipopolysaccharide heptosyltransferase I [Pseudomonadales bacterium]|nr:lipopolysaccharide heptosyltransferase I [Pseudomonadales bacterium]
MTSCMRVLLVKTSSLGDVVHTFAALTDAGKVLPGLRVDWVIEEAYAELPRLHPRVHEVIPVALRRWRRTPWAMDTRRAWSELRHRLQQPYDVVIDAQGLLKSAWLLRLTQGPRFGFDRACVREPLASWFYDHKISVSRSLHAVERSRRLLAAALGYEVQGDVDYGLQVAPDMSCQEAIWLLHGTTWPTKHWPEGQWRQLAERLSQQGERVMVPFGNEQEQERAQRLVTNLPRAGLWQPHGLARLAAALAGAKAVVTVDSGLGHLAAALQRPVSGLYGPTDTRLTGLYGTTVTNLLGQRPCSPCLQHHCALQKKPTPVGWPPCMADHQVDDLIHCTQVR